MKLFITSLILILLLPTTSHAIDGSQIGEKLHTVYGLYLTPHEAYTMKKQQGDKVLMVDVRGRAELKYVGATDLIDANIPSRFIRTDFAWSDRLSTYRTTKNDHFIQDFEKFLSSKGLTRDTPVILICQSGSRVPKAAKELHDAGFKTVYSQYQGFEGIKAKSGLNKGQRVINGWKNAGLPWSYKLKKEAMYFNFDSTQKPSSE